MNDEIYDVVDKKGDKIKQASWTEVHNKGLLHQSVACFVFFDNHRTKILLQQRSLLMDQDPLKYAHSFGGHVLSGLTPQEAIVKKFIQTDFPYNNELFYLYELVYLGPFFPDPKEVKKLQWVSWKNLLTDIKVNQCNYTKSFLNSLQQYISDLA